MGNLYPMLTDSPGVEIEARALRSEIVTAILLCMPSPGCIPTEIDALRVLMSRRILDLIGYGVEGLR